MLQIDWHILDLWGKAGKEWPISKSLFASGSRQFSVPNIEMIATWIVLIKSENLFPFKGLCTKTHFETKGNSHSGFSFH